MPKRATCRKEREKKTLTKLRFRIKFKCMTNLTSKQTTKHHRKPNPKTTIPQSESRTQQSKTLMQLSMQNYTPWTQQSKKNKKFGN